MTSARKILIVDDDAELAGTLVEQLALHEEFEAEARDMTGDSTVAEIEASGGTALANPWNRRLSLVFRPIHKIH